MNTQLRPQHQIESDQPLSCSSCHQLDNAFTDGIDLAHGVDVGTLNTPTILNRSLARKQLFDQSAETLLKRVIRPISNPIEMKASIESVLMALSKNQKFKSLFKIAGLKIDETGIAIALAMFTLKQTQLLEPFERIQNSQASLGQKLFFGKARCSGCHNGVSLTDERRHDTGAAEFERLVKTPSLVRVDRTAPYFHNGSMSTLRAVVDFYDRGFLSQRSRTRRLDTDMRPLGLTPEEKAALVEYLKKLPH